MSVCALVLEAGGDEDQAIAALLHSAIEKHGGLSTLNTIRQLFGCRVADALEFRADGIVSDPAKEGDWRERKSKYLEHLRNANGDALLVASADKLHDARAMLSDAREMGEKSWERFKASKEDQLWLYEAVIEILRNRAAVGTLVNELSTVVAELKSANGRSELVGKYHPAMKPYSPFLTRRFDFALQVASGLHFEQPRKGTGIPYIAHLMAVCSLVLEAGGDEDQAIAALLHDAVEDQGGVPTLDMVRRLFGHRVAAAVMACSDSTVSNPEEKLPWRRRKEEYLDHLRHADKDALIIAVADKLHNARAILSDYRELGEAVWGRFSAPKEDQLGFFASLIQTLRCTIAPTALVDEFERVVSELIRENPQLVVPNHWRDRKSE
jgi:(p)ppGpp synthase/HD superfamily hydrolase